MRPLTLTHTEFPCFFNTIFRYTDHVDVSTNMFFSRSTWDKQEKIVEQCRELCAVRNNTRCYAVLCCAVLCCAVLCCVLLCCVWYCMLIHVLLSSFLFSFLH